MEPTLDDGDWLIATRAGRIGRGTIVVVRHPERALDLVKRVAAIPGDEMEGRQLGSTEYLVEGDNPAASTDGRSFGTVKKDAIEGVVRVRYSPRLGRVR